jgi:hypothetical protein
MARVSYVTTDKDSEFHRLTYFDLATKQPTYLTTNIPWDVDEFDLSDNARRSRSSATKTDTVYFTFSTLRLEKNLPYRSCQEASSATLGGTRTIVTWEFEFNSAQIKR